MIIKDTTIVTTVSDLKELVQHCIVHGYEGQVNLTINGETVNVWQPSKQPAPDSVGIERFPACDEYHEPQPTDIA